MNLEQAKLLAAGARHVRGVVGMLSVGTQWKNPARAVCFVCEMYRAEIVQESEVSSSCGKHNFSTGFDTFFGITFDEGCAITAGPYCTGPECYEVVKALLVKYQFGYLLDDASIEPKAMPFHELMAQLKSGTLEAVS